jgi:Protein of unknown function (DUF3631)
MSGYLLDDAGRFVRRFVVMNDYQRDAVALFTAATHAPDAFDTATYLDVTSPLKRCGKSRLLEALELIVRAPLSASSISTAALYRALEEKKPTLLLDEVDAIFNAKSDKDDLRGIINAGWRRSAAALRMGGSRMTTLEEFSPFGFKVLAGIGDLPDTIGDRSIRIRLKRKTRDESVERFRRRDAEPAGYEIRDRLSDWLEPQIDYLRSLRPGLPDELDDRAQDLWEPLLAVGDLAGDDWPARARAAALALSTGEEREDDSISVQLLRDIQTVFEANGTDRYKTADLLAHLAAVEDSPWAEWYGKPLSSHGLSKLLKPYRIKTMPVRIEGETVRGYKLDQFENAFHRVLGVTSVTGVTSETLSHEGSNARNACNASGTEGDGEQPELDRLEAIYEAAKAEQEAEQEAELAWLESIAPDSEEDAW